MRFSILLVFALLALSQTGWALSSYAQSCTSNADCVQPLVCDSGKCNQNSSVCSPYPIAWTPQPQSGSSSSAVVGAEAAITRLESGTGIIGASSNLYKVGWFSDWRIASLISVAAVIAIIALAAMVGNALDLPEVKAFVKEELVQALATMLVVIAIIGMIGFMDVLSRETVEAMGLPVSCVGGSEPCYMTAAKAYLQILIDTVDQFANNQLKESYTEQNLASISTGIQTQLYWTAFFGVSTKMMANRSLRAERAGMLFETAVKVMSSLSAQKYFLDVISFGIAPIFLLLGIVMRSFFFTRKLGGLFIATAVALFIIYPMTFALAWYTLNTTVYGERAFSITDPNCPGECSANFPVAFYVNSSNGKLYGFESTQQIIQAGINNSNWASGGPGGAYPGLVACRNLEDANIPPNVAPNYCPDCPDYCRTVPFPANLPNCNLTNCSIGRCNPGCKILRQQTSGCANANCGESDCKTDLPVENKCYSMSTGIVKANLSVNCQPCDGCPSWCKIVIKEANGSIRQKYSDQACNKSACKPQGIGGGQCPLKCLYVEKLRDGEQASCSNLCGGCPKECRMKNLTNYSQYDSGNLTGASFLSYCAGYATQCSLCNEGCKITLPASPLPTNLTCSPYPTQTAANCTRCPVYCRFSSFSNYSNYSAIQLETGPSGTPVASNCIENIYQIKCDSASCPNACKTSSYPMLCRQYNQSDSDAAYCRKCSIAGRTNFTYSGAPVTPYFNSSVTGLGANCTNSLCSPLCKNQIAAIPLPDSVPGCSNYTQATHYAGIQCQGGSNECYTIINGNYLYRPCRPGESDTNIIRSIGDDTLPSVVDSIVVGDLQRGKPAQGRAIMFEATRGTGNVGIIEQCKARCNSTTNTTCQQNIMLTNDYSGCKWCPSLCRVDGIAMNDTLCNPEACNATNCPASCKAELPSEASILCSEYLGTGYGDISVTSVAINNRLAPYNSRIGCRQCPENCRIKYSDGTIYEGSCGLLNNTGNAFVDCSIANCPSHCRVTVPKPDDVGICKNSVNVTAPCALCSAFCRRASSQFEGAGAYTSLCGPSISINESGTVTTANACGANTNKYRFGCPSTCYIPSSISGICTGCGNLYEDCKFTPAVRSNCYDVCTAESLAGTANIGPADFLKKLPGADGSSDIKAAGVLLIPGLVLPLFGIVIVLLSIRTLSPIFGGDIDIPGIGRIL